MKDVFVDMMVAMMPLMKPFMWFAVAVAMLGLVLAVSNWLFKTEIRKSVLWSGRIVLAAAGFFLAAQFAGYVLSMPPAVNFGDASKFEFILVSFWQIGLALLIVGLVIRFAGKARFGNTAAET